MSGKGLTVSYNPHWNVGDVITLDGKDYKIIKKVSTAISVQRWYWWDKLLERLFKSC